MAASPPFTAAVPGPSPELAAVAVDEELDAGSEALAGLSLAEAAPRILALLRARHPKEVGRGFPRQHEGGAALHELPPHIPKPTWGALGYLVTGQSGRTVIPRTTHIHTHARAPFHPQNVPGWRVTRAAPGVRSNAPRSTQLRPQTEPGLTARVGSRSGWTVRNWLPGCPHCARASWWLVTLQR